MAIEGEVDVGGECLGMVHSEHTLKDESGLVLVGQSIDRVVQDVVETGHVPIAVGDVDVDRTVRLNEHLESIFKQLERGLQVT